MIIKQAPYSRFSDRRWDFKIELKTPRMHLARCQPEFLINDFPAYWNRLKKASGKEHTGCRKGQSTIKHLPPSQYQQSLGLILAFSLCLNSHSMPCTSRRTSVIVERTVRWNYYQYVDQTLHTTCILHFHSQTEAQRVTNTKSLICQKVCVVCYCWSKTSQIRHKKIQTRTN